MNHQRSVTDISESKYTSYHRTVFRECPEVMGRFVKLDLGRLRRRIAYPPSLTLLRKIISFSYLFPFYCLRKTKVKLFFRNNTVSLRNSIKKETNNNNERKGYHFNGFRIIGMRFL